MKFCQIVYFHSIVKLIRKEGGRTVLSSDAHCAKDVAYLFESFENY